ncbi:MAG: hypothetical protein E7333_03450 [Clostridiales bacterium]|nr:hypothetical protein [Clostridiales bacterium]
MMKMLRLTLMLLALMLPPCVAFGEDIGALTVRILTTPGAEVSLGDNYATGTDLRGEAVLLLPSNAQGDYTLSIQREGFHAREKEVTISGGDCFRLPLARIATETDLNWQDVATITDFTPDPTTYEVPPVEPIAPGTAIARDMDGDGIIRVACLGDSITEGSGNTNWPRYLQDYLNSLSWWDGRTYEVKNFGKGGCTVHHRLEKIDMNMGHWQRVMDEDGDGMAYFLYDDPLYIESLTYPADVVIVQMGTNDGFSGYLHNSEDYFVEDYTTYLIDPYLTRGAQMVLATPTYASNGMHDERVNGWISTAVRTMAAQYGLPLVDMNRLTQPRGESFPDKLHGNESGYRYIALRYANEIFGAELMTVTFRTAPGALVSLGKSHAARANQQGEATFHLMCHRDEGDYDVRIVCDNYQILDVNVTIYGSCAFDMPLTPGRYIVSEGCIATATSLNSERPDNTSDKGLDGNLSTRWESEYENNVSYQLDLGRVIKINGVHIHWENAHAKDYSILVSEDGVNFTQVARETPESAGLVITSFAPVNARYVKVECHQRATGWGFSFYELQVVTDEKN